jgi:transposase
MRKMRDYVVRGKEVFVGLEDSKRSWKLCVRCEGMIVQEISMPAEYGNLESYFGRCYPECRIRVMYEAGFSGFWLHDLLQASGVDCVVTPPHTVTEEKANKIKTDKVDARRLALNLEKGDYKSCSVPDREHREDRQVSRTISQLQRDITANRNRIRKFLDFHGLNEGFPSGRFTKGDYQRVRNLSLSHPLQVSLQALFDVVDKLEELKGKLLLELKAISEKDRYSRSIEIKSSVTGIGWLTAIRLTLEWGDMSRFGSGKKLSSYVGLTSRESSSGDRVHRGRITGQGSGMVRAWLIQSAWRAITKDPVLLEKFQAVRRNSGSKKKAIVAVARKLVVRLHSLERTGELYQIGTVR